jgi:predicted N-formylglutamate amidohydrolase
MEPPQRHDPGGLLAGEERPACDVVRIDGPRPLILACDHAGRRMPRALGTLGVAQEYLSDHIAWDIGAGGVARLLAERLGASAVLGEYSRLVVDLNRDLDDPTAFPTISDGVLIPGNLGLSAHDKAERVRTLFRPYHDAIRRLIEADTDGRRSPVLVAVHSFTPYLHGLHRPWELGILWDKDPRLPLPLMAALRRSGLRIGDNEPYSGRHPADFTIDHHAERAGLAHVGIEVRQDLVGDEQGQSRIADRLASALEAVLGDESLYRPRPS